MKKVLTLVVALFAVLLLSGAAFAANGVDLEWIKVDGDRVEADDNLRLDLGEEIEIVVKLQATEDVEDIEVQARIVGYEYNDVRTIIDVTNPFDLDENDTETVDLSLMIPVRAEKDEYELRIEVDGRRVDYIDESFTIRVKGPRKGVRIRDVVFSPRGAVMAGRALLTQVRMENIGERDLEDVKVIVDIPGLDVSGSIFLEDELEGAKSGEGDIDVTEEVFIRIPKCAEAGTYDVDITVEFDEFESVSTTESIRVIEGETCPAAAPSTPQTPDRTVITPPPALDVVVGQAGTAFPIVITNMGTTSKTYTIDVRGVEAWGTAEVTDVAPIVRAGASKTVYVFVSANEDATAGEKVVGVEITQAGETQEITLTANVVPGEQDLSSIRRGLEIGLIVLVVLLVILGIIIGLSKLKGGEEDDDMKSQTYY